MDYTLVSSRCELATPKSAAVAGSFTLAPPLFQADRHAAEPGWGLNLRTILWTYGKVQRCTATVVTTPMTVLQLRVVAG